jgi:catechol 2,3-dioxygenase
MSTAHDAAATRAVPVAAPASTGGPSLGIRRTHYVALGSPDPETAARFAVDSMGFDLVHVDADGRHYLAAHGLDPYSLVYAPGEPGLDHISYVVADVAKLDGAAALLAQTGTPFERIERSPLWRHAPALRFRTPSGHLIELAPGIDLDVPMAALTSRPAAVPAPICCDHVMPRSVDMAAEMAFATGPFGLRPSSQVDAPGVGPVMGFYRCRTLYHCYAVARSRNVGLHHVQFTLKDAPAVFAAHERMAADPEVEIVWGPVRHGPGHNIAFYFRDHVGNVVEYSAEEEIILDDDTYAPQHWSITDQRANDEWGTPSPASFAE